MNHPTPVRFTDGRDTVVFGREPFVLHDLDMGAAELRGGVTAGRAVTFSAYVLPEGDTPDARRAEMESLCRRVRRIVCAAGGFSLTVGDRYMPLTALRSPVFAHDAPLIGDEAAFFTVYAEAADPAMAYWCGEARTAGFSGWEGRLMFPLAVTEETVFAVRAQSGIFIAENPGDVPCGFTAEITAVGGGIDSFTLTAETGEEIALLQPLAFGESARIDTRPGHKAVTAAGVSALSGIAPESAFFSLQPGMNRLRWACTGEGTAAVTVTVHPRWF